MRRSERATRKPDFLTFPDQRKKSATDNDDQSNSGSNKESDDSENEKIHTAPKKQRPIKKQLKVHTSRAAPPRSKGPQMIRKDNFRLFSLLIFLISIMFFLSFL